ncbi:hypothetical protein [Caldinitratiruptor microaerophilus]|uniref:Uncharacterized protein n=1 Tax=Caldinitratiruptor microaerophilus TaxID=671077 RepID=A0AA35CNK9_9FIRM|nr:hypothetical protein [Caldinitratiruptor microaerophilus]BDG61708.1 hypothetical protein caldi_27980 [Caldinitratiruptor microaerophilus]
MSRWRRSWATAAGAAALAAVTAAGFLAVRARAAARPAPEPGSADDPVVTRSFVEEYVTRALQGLGSGGAGGSGAAPVGPGVPAAAPTLEVVQLAPGQRLVAEGGTEIILRTGRVKVATEPTSLGGLSDLTAGRDVANGQDVAANHLLLVPRSDGRGVVATTAAILLVRGAFAVQ